MLEQVGDRATQGFERGFHLQVSLLEKAACGKMIIFRFRTRRPAAGSGPWAGECLAWQQWLTGPILTGGDHWLFNRGHRSNLGRLRCPTLSSEFGGNSWIGVLQLLQRRDELVNELSKLDVRLP
jgi:hypothetical protein